MGAAGPEALARPNVTNRIDRAPGVSFCSSFHWALLGPTGAHWLDDPPHLSCQDSTGQYAVDDPLLSCKQQVHRSRFSWTPDRQG